MKKLSVKNVIEFRNRSAKSKLGFLNNLLNDREKKEADESGGGDYWISCLSAIKNVFQTNDKALLDEKIDQLIDKIEDTDFKITKDRWQANIDILHMFQEFDYDNLKPKFELTYLKKPDSISVLKIKDIPVEAKPQFVFSFKNKGMEEIGAVWFVIKKGGYKESELGIFSDMIYRYLIYNHSQNFSLNLDFCIAVDVYNSRFVTYNSLVNGDIAFLLDSTIDEINYVLYPPKP
ncbi:MAG: hypothetical protein EOP00_24730 [Pedobacter sp.]|nr:MAG: hypothetical protein EOP00_24730 [Pedobacter sp.]